MKRAMLGAFLCYIVAQQGWAAEPFRENVPESYTVVEGDTLWSVAGRFLENPLELVNVWQNSSGHSAPDKIYPGDVFELVYEEGQPKLKLSRAGRVVKKTSITSGASIPDDGGSGAASEEKRHLKVVANEVREKKSEEGGRTIKLSPKIRATPVESSIPTIPLDVIDVFLSKGRILESEKMLASAPRIVAFDKDGLIGGAGDTLYVQGAAVLEPQRNFEVYRGGQPLVDPKTGEFLGFFANSVGALTKRDVSIEDNIATFYATSASEELRTGDHLLPTEERVVISDYFPTPPKNNDIHGEIVDVVGGVKNTGLFGNVLVNVGTNAGLADGDILAIYREKVVDNKVTGSTVRLPPKRIGVLMAYRTYQKVSIAIVVQANQLIEVGDSLGVP